MPVLKVTGVRLDQGAVGPRQVVAVPQSKAAPPPIAPGQWARNGKSPNARLISALNEAANHAALFRAKQIFAATGKIAAAGIISSSGAGDRARWRFAFRTGPYTHALMAMVVLAPQSSSFGTNSYARIDIATNAAGTPAITSQTFTYGANPVGNTYTGGWQLLKLVTGYIDGVAADTEYYGTVYDVDYGRVQSCVIFDLPSLTENFDGYNATNITAESQILDTYRANLASMVNDVWKKSGATLLNWTVDADSAKRVISSTSPTNIVDGTSTAVGASAPGFVLDMRNRARLSQTSGVPVVLKMYGYSDITAGGGSCTLYLKNSAGTNVATLVGLTGSGAASAQWYSTTATLPAVQDTYYLMATETTGFDLVNLLAVSMYEYET
jgi:hypothetical protein